MMNNTIKFYFSFRSPYSWLAFSRIEKELTGLPVGLDYIPIFPPSPAGSSDRLNPPGKKSRYIIRDVSRFAEAYGMPLKFPRRFDTDWSKPHRGFLFAQRKGKGKEYGLRVYGARFSEGRDVGDHNLLGEIALACGLDQQEFLQSMNSLRYSAQLGKCFAQAGVHRVFGVPTFIYQRQMFWGNDRIDWLVREVKKRSNL
ncbi:MAG: 2-hydroxychromene-2-carboxylate isomerase [Deltaproteobacteria bacterium]|nr:2-hydroxychromene-2-carboxylate isomerase [Deltaproteobacteria bacterium]